MKKNILQKLMLLCLITCLAISGCSRLPENEDKKMEAADEKGYRAPEWTKDAVIYEVNLRQYTQEGTFAAFEEHLDELKEMGINTLWFMPIHPISETNRVGTLGSYYSVSNYREVNPEFGTKEDFAALVESAHNKGFRVMMDWVANHTGWDNPWITEHPDWFTHDSTGNIISPEGMGWDDVADLDYSNSDMMKEMLECMKYWVEEFDIDGYRCDYAPGVPRTFWETARVKLDEIKPVYLMEEDLDWLAKGNLDHAFDTNYNSKVYDVLWQIARDNKNADKLRLYMPQMPEGTFPMNYLDTHDINAYDRTIMEAFGKEAMPSMFSVVFTLPGVPMIYSGDEIGYDKMIAFMDKDPIDWESSDVSYRDLIGRLSTIKSENEALFAGSYGGEIEIIKNENKNILTYKRTKGDNTVVCVFNLSKRVQEADLSEVITGSESVLLHGTGEEYETTAKTPTKQASLEPWEFYLMVE